MGDRMYLDPGEIRQHADRVDRIGGDVARSATQIGALTVGASGSRAERGTDGSGTAAVFGAVHPAAVTVATKYNQLLAELALLGTTLGRALEDSARAMKSAAANHEHIDDALAGNQEPNP